jgi:hypothetical protein
MQDAGVGDESGSSASNDALTSLPLTWVSTVSEVREAASNWLGGNGLKDRIDCGYLPPPGFPIQLIRSSVREEAGHRTCSTLS